MAVAARRSASVALAAAIAIVAVARIAVAHGARIAGIRIAAVAVCGGVAVRALPFPPGLLLPLPPALPFPPGLPLPLPRTVAADCHCRLVAIGARVSVVAVTARITVAAGCPCRHCRRRAVPGLPDGCVTSVGEAVGGPLPFPLPFPLPSAGGGPGWLARTHRHSGHRRGRLDSSWSARSRHCRPRRFAGWRSLVGDQQLLDLRRSSTGAGGKPELMDGTPVRAPAVRIAEFLPALMRSESRPGRRMCRRWRSAGGARSSRGCDRPPSGAFVRTVAKRGARQRQSPPRAD